VDPSIEVKRGTKEGSQEIVSSLVLLFGTPVAGILAHAVYKFVARNSGAKIGAIWGAHTKRKFKYGKERSPRGLECECTQKERSTSITKQLVFQYQFCLAKVRALPRLAPPSNLAT
jgi:hypothetical protein